MQRAKRAGSVRFAHKPRVSRARPARKKGVAMKLTKEEWKSLNDRLVMALRPLTMPVAVKLINDEKEFDQFENLQMVKNVSTGCQLIGIATHFHMTIGITPDKFMTTYCGANCGCCERDKDWHEGVLLANPPYPWQGNLEASKAHMQSYLETLPEKPYAGMVCSCLDDNNVLEPDCISVQIVASGAFYLMAGLIESEWQKVWFPFSGESQCVDTWMYTIKTGKPGLSLGCRGDRALGNLSAGDVRITLTVEDFIKAVDGVEALQKRGIDYPYFAPIMLPENV